MELHSEVFTAEYLHPGQGFARVQTTVEQRWDPLTGHGARLVAGAGPLFPRSELDLAALARETARSCPFCPPLVETVTPKLPPEVWPDARIQRGQALLFPNLLTYAKHASVSLYGPELHYLPLGAMTPRLVVDNLATQVTFVTAVLGADPGAQWTSINANHMLPSGSSLFHPHMQGAAHPQPTSFQRLLAATPPERFVDYLETERRLGVRYLGSTGSVHWLASFAPVGPAELRGLVPGVASLRGLSHDVTEELGHGMAAAFNLYAELGFECCNAAVYGTPDGTPGYPFTVRTVCRANLQPLYRSDVMWMERLH